MTLMYAPSHTEVRPDHGATDPQAWRRDALCAQTDPEAFFPDDGNVADAKRMCARCCVRESCLSHALSANEPFGVWGGLSATERRKLLRTTSGTPRTSTQAAKDVRDARIRSLADDSVDIATIATEAGVTERTVHRVLSKHRQARAEALSA